MQNFLKPTSIVDDCEVALGSHIRNNELGVLVVGLLQLVHEGLVGGLREEAFFVEESENSHRFFDQIDGGLEVETEIDEVPLDAFFLVFFLFEDEHGVVEQLLEFLVGVVDTELLERVQLEDFKTENCKS